MSCFAAESQFIEIQVRLNANLINSRDGFEQSHTTKTEMVTVGV
jgi:hypothetical protein